MAETSPKNNIYLVVMAGGSGTRFWPKSTSKRPKQLIPFQDKAEHTRRPRSLLVQTLDRFEEWVPSNHMMIVTTESLAPAVEDQIARDVRVLAEPQGRNTAPCVYWAAREIEHLNPNGIMLVMPSDHFITHMDAFTKTVQMAAERAAKHGELVTLGVKPTRPETGYGYLKVGDPIEGECRKVEAFVEKPDAKKAEKFVSSGDYLWNGGMFVWSVKSILAAFDEYLPEYRTAWDKVSGHVGRAYPELAATSIDYAIMERAKNVVTYPLDCGWDDLGSWVSFDNRVGDLCERTDAGIALSGKVIGIDSSGTVVDAPNKLVALLGVNDLIVVECNGAILVAHKDRAQDIRQVVDRVKKARPDLA
ncbi:MAG: mannose-1-phosphate guanylyltransferase [Bacteriovoracia bacterium]